MQFTILREWINDNMINWTYLSKFLNNIDFLNTNLDKLDWSALSCNIHAVEILENNIDKIQHTEQEVTGDLMSRQDCFI